MSIARLPPVLALHVKRFEAGGLRAQVFNTNAFCMFFQPWSIHIRAILCMSHAANCIELHTANCIEQRITLKTLDSVPPYCTPATNEVPGLYYMCSTQLMSGCLALLAMLADSAQLALSARPLRSCASHAFPDLLARTPRLAVSSETHQP